MTDEQALVGTLVLTVLALAIRHGSKAAASDLAVASIVVAASFTPALLVHGRTRRLAVAQVHPRRSRETRAGDRDFGVEHGAVRTMAPIVRQRTRAATSAGIVPTGDPALRPCTLTPRRRGSHNRAVAAAAHRLAFVLTLVVAFVALQTGWACAYADDCADEATQTCNDDEGEAPCGPTCTDCVGCSGPARALLADRQWLPMPSCLTVEVDTHVAELAPEAEPGRIDRPPRA